MMAMPFLDESQIQPSAAPPAAAMPGATGGSIFNAAGTSVFDAAAPLEAPALPQAAPAAPDRSALGEIFTGVKQGIEVATPKVIGQALQYTGNPGDTLYDTGAGMVAGANARAADPDLTLSPTGHNAVTNALAGGAAALGPAAIPLGLGAAIGAIGASPVIAAGAMGLGAAGLFGMSSGQDTLEKARAAGVPEDQALAAGRLSAVANAGTQGAMALVGGKVLGVAGEALSRAVSSEATSAAGDVLGQLTGQSSALAGVIKTLPMAAAENVALGASQSAAQAGIEQHYGISDQSPLSAAEGAIAPALGQTALLAPFGLAGRVLRNNAAAGRTSVLADANADPAQRQALADQYTSTIGAVGTPEAQEAATQFAANAKAAIAAKTGLTVDASMFNAPAPPEAPAAEPLRIGYDPTSGQTPIINFPNGQSGTADEVNAHINALPENQQVAARAALFGYGEQTVEPTDPAAVQNWQEAQDLHGQVKDAITAAGLEPAAVPAKDQFAAMQGPDAPKGQALASAYREFVNDPATQRALMEQDAQTYQGMLAREGTNAANDATVEAPGTTGTEAPPPNTAVADAFNAALKQRDVDQAHATVDAQIQAQREAIANRAQGENLASAAEAGQVQPDPNAPKAKEDIVSDWTAANTEAGMGTNAQSRVPFEKRMDSLGIADLPTHAAQIDALQTAVDDPKSTMSQGVKDRMSALLDSWKSDQASVNPPLDESAIVPTVEELAAPSDAAAPDAAPAEAPPAAENVDEAAASDPNAIPGAPPVAAVAPDNITPAAPGEAGPPANAPDLGDNLPATPRAAAAEVAPRLQATLDDFQQRIAGGETLSPLEQERFEDAQGLSQSLGEINNPQNDFQRGRSADYINDITSYADEATRPYTTSQRLNRYTGAAPEVSSPEANNPRVLGDGARTGNLSDTLTNLAQNGSQEWVKKLAGKLSDLGVQAKVRVADLSGDDPTLRGSYDRRTNQIAIDPGSVSEATVLHEATHAATAAAIDKGFLLQDKPAANQDESKLKSAFQEVEAIRTKLLTDPATPDRYGLTNAHEFIAELNSNPDFQEYLKNAGTGRTSLWDRTVDAVRKLLGMPVEARNMLDRAMTVNDAFFGNKNYTGARDFLASPEGAARTTDLALRNMADTMEKLTGKADFATVGRNVYKALLGWRTTQFIADRLRTMPEMVRSGFTEGMDAHMRALTSRKLAMAKLGDKAGAYVGRLDAILRKAGDADKQRELSRQMMTIGGEGSRMGFDFTKNFNDNVAAGRKLDNYNKPYVDDIHRQYTQLLRTNPEAAKAIAEGAMLNRGMLTTRVATVVSQLMNHASGDVPELQAALARMDPRDPQYAAMQERTQRAAQESLLSAKHTAGLDYMNKSLDTAKNSDPTRFFDGAASKLHSNLMGAFAEASRLPDGSNLKAQLQELQGHYTAQEQNPYYSLGRDGDYFAKIDYKGMDAQTEAKIRDALKGMGKVVGGLGADGRMFFRTKTLDQATALQAKLLQAAGRKVVDGSAAAGKIADKGMTSAQGVTPALRTILDTLHDQVNRQDGLTATQAINMKDAMTRELLSLLPETSSRSAQMQRAGVPGYDADFKSNFGSRASGAVNDTANIYTQRAFAAAAKARAESVTQLNRGTNPDIAARAQMADDEVNKRYANSMTKLDTSAINTIKSLGHTFYLGASPGFIIRNMVQPYHRALPILGSRFGFVKSAAEITRAAPVAFKVLSNTIKQATSTGGARGLLHATLNLDGLGLNQRERAFMQELHDRGELDQGQAQQLQADNLGGPQAVQNATRYASLFATYSEMLNRITTGLAAFRLAEGKAGAPVEGSFEKHTDYAVQAIDRGMDNFDPGNTARQISKFGFAGKVTPLLTQFMNYNLQTMQQIERTVHDGFLAKDPSAEGIQRAGESRREFAQLMATTTMIAGVMGLPFVSALAGVYNMLTKDKDHPSDIRIDARNFLARTFGQKVGDMIANGPMRATGLDTSTFGLQDLLPGSEFLDSRELMKDRIEGQSMQLLGPAINGAINITNGLSKMSDGYWSQGVEAMLPSGLKPYYKAAKLATVGYTDGRGNPLPLKADASDIFWQSLGFQSTKKTLQGDAQEYMSTNEKLLADRRAVINDQIYKAVTAGTPADQAAAMAARARFNAENPYTPIRSVADTFKEHARANAFGALTGTGVPLANRRQLPALRDLAFAIPDGSGLPTPPPLR